MAFTDQDRVAWREVYLNEPGTEPPCPFCGRPRVRRSDYIRCNRDATNWLMETPFQKGEDLTKDPRIERHAEMLRTRGIKPHQPGTSDGVPTAIATTSDIESSAPAPVRKSPVSATVEAEAETKSAG